MFHSTDKVNIAETHTSKKNDVRINETYVLQVDCTHVMAFVPCIDEDM